MKIFIKRNCAAQGQHLVAGETYDLPESVARSLVTMGRASAVSGEQADKPIKVRDPQLQSRDPQIAVGDDATATLGKHRK